MLGGDYGAGHYMGMGKIPQSAYSGLGMNPMGMGMGLPGLGMGMHPMLAGMNVNVNALHMANQMNQHSMRFVGGTAYFDEREALAQQQHMGGAHCDEEPVLDTPPGGFFNAVDCKWKEVLKVPLSAIDQVTRACSTQRHLLRDKTKKGFPNLCEDYHSGSCLQGSQCKLFHLRRVWVDERRKPHQESLELAREEFKRIQAEGKAFTVFCPNLKEVCADLLMSRLAGGATTHCNTIKYTTDTSGPRCLYALHPRTVLEGRGACQEAGTWTLSVIVLLLHLLPPPPTNPSLLHPVPPQAQHGGKHSESHQNPSVCQLFIKGNGDRLCKWGELCNQAHPHRDWLNQRHDMSVSYVMKCKHEFEDSLPGATWEALDPDTNGRITIEKRHLRFTRGLFAKETSGARLASVCMLFLKQHDGAIAGSGCTAGDLCNQIHVDVDWLIGKRIELRTANGDFDETRHRRECYQGVHFPAGRRHQKWQNSPAVAAKPSPVSPSPAFLPSAAPSTAPPMPFALPSGPATAATAAADGAATRDGSGDVPNVASWFANPGLDLEARVNEAAKKAQAQTKAEPSPQDASSAEATAPAAASSQQHAMLKININASPVASPTGRMKIQGGAAAQPKCVSPFSSTTPTVKATVAPQQRYPNTEFSPINRKQPAQNTLLNFGDEESNTFGEGGLHFDANATPDEFAPFGYAIEVLFVATHTHTHTHSLESLTALMEDLAGQAAGYEGAPQ